MKEIQIKSEYLPQRCEICHRSDSYDPEQNLCLRCKDIDIKAESQQPSVNKNPIMHFSVNFLLYRLVAALLIIFLGLIALAYSGLTSMFTGLAEALQFIFFLLMLLLMPMLFFTGAVWCYTKLTKTTINETRSDQRK